VQETVFRPCNILRSRVSLLGIKRVHNVAETADQRAAITDRLHWLHQYDLLTQAQADVTAKA
jgi:hypothetical protein